MFDILLEIIVPLLISFAVGLFAGWLLWRWRRTPVSNADWQLLSDRASTAERRLVELSDEKTELERRLAERTSPQE